MGVHECAYEHSHILLLWKCSRDFFTHPWLFTASHIKRSEINKENKGRQFAEPSLLRQLSGGL